MYSPRVVGLTSKGTEEEDGCQKAVGTALRQKATEEAGRVKKGEVDQEQHIAGRDLKGTEDVGVR
jgi:hypothetical protein